MRQYLDHLQYILDHGDRVPTRAVLKSTGKPVEAISVLGYQNRYDLRKGFPAITTKKLFLKGVVAELLWFLDGDTKAKTLWPGSLAIWLLYWILFWLPRRLVMRVERIVDKSDDGQNANTHYRG